jgi:ubiquinone/menaquinone biosynthesis C-methylase UbiE
MAGDDVRSRAAVIDTFRARARHYDRESEWVSDLALIDPLLLPTPGSGPGILLDVCGGTGVVARRAHQLGWRPVVVDLVAEMLSQRAPAALCPAIRADANALPFRAKSVERIVVRQGLQYLILANVIQELDRVARSVAIGQIVAASSDDVVTWRRYFRLASPGRKTVFVRGQIVRMVRAAGMEIVASKQTSSTARLGDAVGHLKTADRAAAIAVFRSASAAFRRRNSMADDLTEDSTYKVMWEFVVAAHSVG